MALDAKAYLVEKKGDGFGEYFPLIPGQACTIGRSNSNRIVVKDDLSSRDHADITYTDGAWLVRDLSSLNGTRVDSILIEPDVPYELEVGCEITVGRNRFLFVEEINQLDTGVLKNSKNPQGDSGVRILSRQRTTRYLTPLENPPAIARESGTEFETRHGLRKILSTLYHLALDMSSADTVEMIGEVVIDSLMKVTPAVRGAVVVAPAIPQGDPERVKSAALASVKTTPRRSLLLDMKVVVHLSRQPDQGKIRPDKMKEEELLGRMQPVAMEVLASGEAVRAEDSESGAGQSLARGEKPLSRICAPVLSGKTILALIYLEGPMGRDCLEDEDLELSIAIARQMSHAILQIRRQQSLSAANRTLRDQLHVESELIGSSPAMKEVETQIGRVAGTNATCLIRGESGVGKELVARALHYSSPRREGPFVCLNCAALTETLLESELFGHEKGSFTGATERKIGKFEAADHGTIFLDEIGEMNVGTQSKLLRILEGQPFERVGGNSPIRVDVRVVAATNQPLEKAVGAGTFRLDLFYRLQVVQLMVPPLRDRRGDIAPLAEHFLGKFVREMGRKLKGFTPEALQKLTEYHWPGNVRELRNVVERAVALAPPTAQLLDAPDIWLSSLQIPGLTAGPHIAASMQPPMAGGSLPPSPGGSHGGSGSYREFSLEDLEKQHIEETLKHTEWNKSQAATILGIERSTLDRKIRSYGIKHP